MPVPQKLQLRLPGDLCEALQGYMNETGLDRSAAVRTLLRRALGEPADKAAMKEGISKGIRLVQRHLGSAVEAAFGDLEGELG